MSRQRAYQKRSEEPSYYEILGVTHDASADEIKARYKALVLKFHPDREKSSIANDAMVSISHAYEVLSDEKRRFAYDLALKTSEEKPRNDTPHAKRGRLPVVYLSKKSRLLIIIAIAISSLVGYQVEAWQGDSKSVSDQFMHANSHYFAAIVHEPLFSLPLFIPGFGLAWGALGNFIFGFEDHAVLAVPVHANASGLFLLYFILAISIKLFAYYLGMTRSLILVISIRQRRFSKLENIFTQADIILAVILAAVAGLVEHAMVNAS